MKLAEIVKFESIDFDNLEIPSFVTEVESKYDEELVGKNYILEQTQYDEYTAKWARVYDWYCLQFARATYNKKKTEDEMSRVYMKEASRIPETVKTKAAKEAWIQQNSPAYHDINTKYTKAAAYFIFFDGKKDSTKIKHYNCKGMSSSIDKDKPVGGYAS